MLDCLVVSMGAGGEFTIPFVDPNQSLEKERTKVFAKTEGTNTAKLYPSATEPQYRL
jgi:hypothetical protein